MTNARLMLLSALCTAAAYLLAVNPAVVQVSRCAAQHVYKDDQCEAAAFQQALSRRGWRTALQHPDWALDAHATAVQSGVDAVLRAAFEP